MLGTEVHPQIGDSGILQGGASIVVFHIHSKKWAYLDEPAIAVTLLILFYLFFQYVTYILSWVLGDDLYWAYGAFILPIVTL